MVKAIDRSHSGADGKGKEFLNLGWSDYAWPLAFMLSASMVGLRFPLGYLLIVVVLINRFIKNKYDFIIQLTLFFGGFQLLHQDDLHLPLDKLVFLISAVLIILFRKNRLMVKTVGLLVLYALGIMVFVMLSEERLRVQLTGIIIWLSFIYFIVPLAVFSGREFDIKVFFRHVFVYAFIFCIYYILDGIVLGGNVFMPRDSSAVFYGQINTFMSLPMSPLSFKRIWPIGLYILTLCLFPMLKYYRLTKLQWALIVIALAVSRTFMLIIAVSCVFVMFQGNKKLVFRYAVIGIIAMFVLYHVDTKETFVSDDGEAQTMLRIRSSVDQFISLADVQDEEDLAKFGTTRMAQIIPKWQLLYDLNRQWIGFGFLSRSETKMTKYIIINELYTNPELAEEVATGVEVVPIQIILTVGYLGLIIHVLFLIGLWMIVRKLRYAKYFLSVMIAFILLGLSGLSGMVYIHGLYMSALAYGAVVLANRRELGGFALPQLKPTK